MRGGGRTAIPEALPCLPAWRKRSSTLPMTPRALLADTLSPLVDLVYPPRCPACGAGLARQVGLCAECWDQLVIPSAPSCGTCQRPFGESGPDDGAICALDWFIVNLLNRVVDLEEDKVNRITGVAFVDRNRRAIVVAEPDSPQARAFRHVAEGVLEGLGQAADGARPQPRIVIED